MIRKFAICFAFLQFVLISFHPHSALGEFNCAFLDPRASVSQTKEGKIEASVDTLYKVAKAGGSIEGKVKNEIENLQKGVPVSEQVLIKLRTLYLFCGMVVNAKDIQTERKVELFNSMMNVKGESPGSASPNKNKTKKDKKVSANSPEKGDNVVATRLRIDDQYNVLNSSDGFRAFVLEILTKMEKGDKVKIKLEISESHDLRGDLNALSKRKYLSVKQKEERYYLQKFLSRRDQKLDWIEKTLERTFVNTRKINLVSSPDDWMQVISGILERTTQVEVLSGAIKLDLWQEEPCQLNAPVYISDEDMDSLLRKLDLPDSRALAVGKGGGYYAIDLPRKVLLKKAIPAIAVSVHEAFEAKTCSSNDIETQYGPSNWYMGLG